mmetsp:Transcript_29970/g.71972  ORF Transcript_29970/g.71972 Transcript_29970/m.71972 type:complete len:572 (+) Transcript_29970:150-1865(+)|eukprot:CAMPEP_0113625548 /NCGR_PEP_ID=MMETSP0017_2-20120614/13198_1 /TAXON_ID=2856 /ORGANISM="Cylindrotheca closterium" /LENGTH=571 /DNA_ID=CAMNT_0000535669 /DNA_START=150 /DNA_END=1865 /DNA_ORIENTATION=- /assembly_acc=CAM_ASM_000147
MKIFQVFAAVIVALQFHAVMSAEDKCAKTNQYKCPSTTCNSTIWVKDCLDCDGFLSTDAKTETCFDRKILNGKDNPSSDYLWRDILGLVLWFCAAGIATACGVGGGGIYVPVGILLLNFMPKPSSGLSQASIFGASLGGLLLNIRNKHPYTTKYEYRSTERGGNVMESCEMDAPPDTDNVRYFSRPLIDFDMALFLAPMEMAGAVMGVIVQKLLPNWLYLTLAAIILGFTAYKTYKKFLDTRRKEKAKHEAAAAAAAAESDAPVPEGAPQDTNESKADPPSVGETDEEHHEEHDTDNEPAVGDNDGDEAEIEATCEKLLLKDSRQLPSEKVFALIILWFGLIALTFLKGGKGVDSVIGITCASPWYGVLIGTQFLWTLGFACLFGWRLTKQTAEKKRVNYPFHPQDVLWDFEKTRFYAFFTFIAGVVAGLIGIGGGMVLGPLMLVMGIHPRVSSATTATMIVLTSSSVAVLFVTAGLVPWTYAVTFFSTCFCGALVGKKYIDGIVKKTGKASILIFMLATIIAFATVGCIVTVLMRLSSSNWCLEGFKKFCNLKDEDSDEDMCMINQVLRL